MAVYKDNATGTWRVVFRYTDFTGERKQTQVHLQFLLSKVL